jgi:hypothetical protein
MNLIIQSAINIIIKLLIGSDVFKRIEARVHAIEKEALSGLEKRDTVLSQAKTLGIKASTGIILLAIQFAWLKMTDYSKI